MSDEDTKKPGGYRLEYASSNRSKCKGPKPCSGTAIPKGALRMGSQIDFRGNTTFVWRHWGCVTPQILANFKKSFEGADELDGFEELKAVDKERVRKAWEDGKVADEDIPESAKGGGGEEEEEAKPKKKRAPAKKKAKKDDAGDDDDDVKPKKKAPAKKAPAKKKAMKKRKASDSEGEDLGEELDQVSDDEEDADDDAEAGKKRKRPSKKAAAPKKTKKSKKEAISDGDDD